MSEIVKVAAYSKVLPGGDEFCGGTIVVMVVVAVVVVVVVLVLLVLVRINLVILAEV